MTRLGGLTLAVLNAGVGGFGALVDLEAAEWDRVIGRTSGAASCACGRWPRP